MADVSHELGALRFVVDSPLSSKVAMFNNQVQQHKDSQKLNPFSNINGRMSPKPTFSKDEYGKPLAGSLTELRGQKANMHVMREMLELCQIISSEGYEVGDEPNMRVIPFGELFNIYNYISDKVVGILLRARKYKLLDFEGEMLFQRRDDDVPIFLLKPIQEIRRELEAKIEEIKRASSPAPQATSVLLDRSAHQEKLKQAGLSVPGSQRTSKSKSRSPSPSKCLRSIASAPTIVVQDDAPTFVEEPPKPSSSTNENIAPTTQSSLPPQKQPSEVANIANDLNNNEDNDTANNAGLPVIVVEASAVYVRRPSAASESNTNMDNMENASLPPQQMSDDVGKEQVEGQGQTPQKITFY